MSSESSSFRTGNQYSLFDQGQQGNQYHLLPELDPTRGQPAFSLGVDTNFGTFSTPSVYSEQETSPSFTLSQSGSASALGLYGRTAKAFIKAENPSFQVPPALKMVGVAGSAAIVAGKLIHNIDEQERLGHSTAQAYTCGTVRTFAEELTGRSLKTAVVAGVPGYFAAVVTNPPLAATLPFVLPLIPDAYQGAHQTGVFAGQFAEGLCNQGFDIFNRE